MTLDLKVTVAHSAPTSQKLTITPEDWTPFLRSYWINIVASNWNTTRTTQSHCSVAHHSTGTQPKQHNLIVVLHIIQLEHNQNNTISL